MWEHLTFLERRTVYALFMAYWTDLKTFCATTYVDVAFAYLFFLSFKYFVFVMNHAKAFAVKILQHFLNVNCLNNFHVNFYFIG